MLHDHPCCSICIKCGYREPCKCDFCFYCDPKIAKAEIIDDVTIVAKM